MGIKGKILSIISFVSLAIALFAVGIWAVTETNFKVTGSIEYIVPVPDATDYSYLTFSYDDSTLTASVTDCDTSVTSVEIPARIRYNSNTYDVTSIADASSTSLGAFYGCSSLASITIPASVTKIGNYAFYNCKKITSITIPNSVTSIGSSAFCACSGLKEVIIGSGVRSIGSKAFYNCSGLETIIVDSNNTVYDSRNNCNAIIETSTNTLILGTNNSIIPDGVTSIGNNAFYYCTNLTSITIPNSVKNIGSNAFFNCSGLETIVVDSNNTVYDSRNNCNAIIKTSTNTLILGTNNSIIPDGVTSIGFGAFYNCRYLTSITIPESVTSIGSNAFQYCSQLTSITIPESVTTIGSSAFDRCTKLTTLIIDSETVSSDLTAKSSSVMGYILYKATTIYIKTGLSVGSYVTTNFTTVEEITSGDYVGYTKYTA